MGFAERDGSFSTQRTITAERRTHRLDRVDPLSRILRRDQQALFEQLRALRTTLARERGVPPYVVFSDKTIMAIARNRQAIARHFCGATEFGERKLSQYGEHVLKLVRRGVSE